MSLYGETVGMYNLPCSCKVRHEMRASEELRRLDLHYGRTVRFPRQSRNEFRDQAEHKDDSLGSLMFRLFALNDQARPPATTNAFTAWQTCLTLRQHKGGYLNSTRTPSSLSIGLGGGPTMSTFGVLRSSSATESSNDIKPFRRAILAKETRARSDTFIEAHHGYNQEKQDGEFHRSSSLEFYHFNKSTEYIKYYRDRITSENIRSHIQSRILQNAAKKPVPTNKKEKSRVCSKNTFFRFRVTKGKDGCNTECSILRVGAYPAGMKPAEKIEIDCTKGQAKGSRVLLDQKGREKVHARKNVKVATMYDIKSESKERYSGGGERHSLASANLYGRSPKPSNHIRRIQDSPGQLKQVRLKVHDNVPSSHYQMAKHAAITTITKAKQINQPKIYPKKNSSDPPRKLPCKPTLGEREFLHITTPMSLSVHQNGDSSITPTTSPSWNTLKSTSPALMEYVSIQRNTGAMTTELFLKREPQAAFPKNSNFQACITPANYSKSSIASQLREKREPGETDEVTSFVEPFPSDEQLQEPRKIHRVASRPSVPQIGPFLSG